jgi:hypothetical protein
MIKKQTLNPKSLKPSQLLRLVNSTKLGEVVADRTVKRHRDRAGYQIGDDTTVDIYKYAAWLTKNNIKPTMTQEEKSEADKQRKHEKVFLKQRLDLIPEPLDKARRTAGGKSLKFFCKTYFPDVFYLEWSKDQLKALEKIERSVLRGGLYALAMPRGSGKTTLMEVACLWAALYGYRRFICLIACSKERARKLLGVIKTWVETNPLLLADFPEICIPAKSLEGSNNRQKGQRWFNGDHTHIVWNKDEIIFPTGHKQKSEGIIITCAGLDGSDIRGQQHATRDGEIVRPDLVMIDDPQTRESAHSAMQSQDRESLLSSDVIGMAGPKKKLSGLMACTVICNDDMSDRMLDRKRHPEWHGERTMMVYRFPANEKLWEKYAEILRDELENDGDGSDATRFYAEHRKEMDKGALVAWEGRYNEGEISGIQSAMNIKILNEAAFWAEYQNKPQAESLGEDMLSASAISEKTNNLPRGIVPLGCSYLTMFTDVQGAALFWVVCAFEDNFTGYVVDYGAWPDQPQGYYTLSQITKTIRTVCPGAGLEAAIYNALEKLTAEKLGTEYRRQDGVMMRIDRNLIDANWGDSTDVIYQFSRQSAYAATIMPSHGKYVGASSTPFSEYKKKKGDQVGHHYRVPSVTGKRAVRYVLIDTNYWKSFVHSRLAVPMGDAGCLSLFGNKPRLHEMFADHVTSEYRVRTEAKGRTVDEWKIKPHRPDNHWFDCLVGCHVAASICGARIVGMETKAKHENRKKIRLSELQRQKAVGE